MQIHISTKDGVPIFQQIVTQIKHMVASGRLAPGEIVPPIRALAEQLLINPNTVARAYKELESEGIFISRQGSGTRVAEKGSPLDYSERLQVISKLIEGLLVEANQLDFKIEELIEIIRQKNHLFKSAEKGELLK
jgi:GntR family transcriptional regulator